MRYFHVPPDQIFGKQVKVTGGELHHLMDVLRLHKGDEFVIIDGSGGVYDVVLVFCGRDVAIGEIRGSQRFKPPPSEVSLFVGLPKADRMDMIVQKATELGAHRIVPVLCKRIVPRLSAERSQQRVARWRQIAIEASKQSHRVFFPMISNIMNFDDVLKESKACLKLIFDERKSPANNHQRFTVPSKLKDVLKQNARAKTVDIFIGPEGGFADEEISCALLAGAIPVSLGNNILRTETAAIAALSIVLYEKDIAYN